MEYYILMAKNEIVGVFDTLLECLSWTPTKPLEEPIEVQRVLLTDSGEFKIQRIDISKDIYLKR